MALAWRRATTRYAQGMDPSSDGVLALPVLALEGDQARHVRDHVTVEEPLEMRVAAGADDARRLHTLAVTMRTPGDDPHLAAGFLLSEGVVKNADDIESIDVVPADPTGQPSNRVVATLSPRVHFDPDALRRDVYAASSCGICGRASIDRIRAIASEPPQGRFVLPRATLLALPESLRAAQSDFARTGGVHAAGLFQPDGTMIDLREDVGRHNAVDKVLGRRFRRGELPSSETVLVVSGRAGFELVHKAVVAGVPMLAAVGAPSTLAVSLAKTFGLTLVGFLRDQRFNLYTGAERVDTT